MKNIVTQLYGVQHSFRVVAKKVVTALAGIVLVGSSIAAAYPSLAYAVPSGSGTPDDPIIITNCTELQGIADNLAANYKIGNNIDCSDTINWNAGAGFQPIGTLGGYFTGNLDGNSKLVTGLFINRAQNQIGLFGVVDQNAAIHDLTLANVNITGQVDTGALAGISAGTITNCRSSGTVNGTQSTGGLVGMHTEQSGIGSSSPLVYTWNGSDYTYVADVGHTIPNNLRGNDSVALPAGSLAPKNGVYNMKISQEYDEVVYYDELALKTYDTTAGYEVVPQLDVANAETGTTINDTPTNPAQSCVDKFGHNCLAAISSIDNTWTYKDPTNVNTFEMNFGDLSGAARKMLIINGVRDFTATSVQSLRSIQVKNALGQWTNVFSNRDQINSLKGAPRTVALDMSNAFPTNDYHVKIGFDKAQLNYVAMDTSPVQAYAQATYHPSSVNLGFRGYTSYDSSGPYWIHNYNDVYSYPAQPFSSPTGNFTKYGEVAPLLQSTNNQYVVMHHGDSMDINFDYNAVPAGKQRSFILYSWAEYKHAASQDWTHSVTPLPFQGMPSYPYPEGVSYPLTADNLQYLAQWNTRVYTAPIQTNHHTIITSSSSATVHGSDGVGGLVGRNRAKLITGSYATGDVTATNGGDGGLVGINNNGNAEPGQIEKSYATGNVVGGSGVGGLVGYNYYSIIDQSFATGSATTINNGGYAGGLAGYIIDDGSHIVHDVYATGAASAASTSAGGLTGYVYGAVITNAVATGTVIASSNAGGIVGSTSGSNTLTNTFWDTQSSGISSAADTSGLGIGKTTAQLKDLRTFTQHSFNADLASTVFDFTGTQYDDAATADIWTIDGMTNSGYPYFGQLPLENAAPNGGDANGDGTPDGFQTNVLNIVDPVTNKYAALEVSPSCNIDSNVIQSASSLAVGDMAYRYPAGLMNFTIDCATQGATATITQYYYGLTGTLVARKFNPTTNTYSTIPGATIQHVLIGGQTVTKVTYQIVDGGPLDQDGTANGIIVDPSGLGLNTVSAPNTGLGGSNEQ